MLWSNLCCASDLSRGGVAAGLWDMETFLLACLLFFLVLAVLALHCCLGFFPVAASGGYILVAVRASHCGGLSCCRARALGARASVAAAQGSIVGAPRL